MHWLTLGMHVHVLYVWGSPGRVFVQSLTPAEVRAEKRAVALRKAAEEEKRKSDLWASVRRLLKSPGFQVGRWHMRL